MVGKLWGGGSLFETGLLEDILEFLIECWLDLTEILMKRFKRLFLDTALRMDPRRSVELVHGGIVDCVVVDQLLCLAVDGFIFAHFIYMT